MTAPAIRRPVLMTTDPIGGVWSYTLELCRELNRRGISTALASMGRRLTARERAEVHRLARVELFESAFKLEWMGDPWRDVALAGEWLSDLAQRIAPGMVHLNQFSHGALAWPAPCLVVGHSCVYSWFDAVKRTSPGFAWRTYQQRVARGLRGADCVTAPSRWLLQELKNIYGDFSAVAPIPNGRQAARFAPAAKENFILTAGRLWDEAKNIAVLDPVATRVRWAICAAGDAASPEGRSLAFENLVLLGRLDSAALAAWMSRAAIFVLPARYEPFGLAVLEAGLSGCALVLGDIPSLREIWADAALFVAPDDREAIAAALAALIADATLRRRLAAQARRRAVEFTSARMACAYVALYRRMIATAESEHRFEPAPGSPA